MLILLRGKTVAGEADPSGRGPRAETIYSCASEFDCSGYSLLYEARMDKLVDRVLVVYADKAQQIQRLRRRNGLSRHDALLRISAQMPLSKKCRRADFVVRNTDTLVHLRSQVSKLLKQLA